MGQDKPTQLSPLERASLNHWTYLRPPEDGDRSSLRNVVVFLSYIHRTMDKVQNKPYSSVLILDSPNKLLLLGLPTLSTYASFLLFMIKLSSRHLLSCWSIWLILHLSRRRRHVPPKRRFIFDGIHGVILQKTELFNVSNVCLLKTTAVQLNVE
jgi:hypothetical protein